MQVWLPETTSISIFKYAYYEAGLTFALCRLLRAGDVVFDIGAHFGYFSLLAAKIVGNRGRVEAFEPTPSSQATLQRNLRSAGNTTSHQIAVWDSVGRIELADFGPLHSAYNTATPMPRFPLDINPPPSRVFEVRATSVDFHVRSRGLTPTFIKIDVENAEDRVLAGMEETIKTSHPMISLEVGDNPAADESRSADLVSNLVQEGYSVFQTELGNLVEHHIQWSYDYANLIFVHPCSPYYSRLQDRSRC